MKQYLFKVGSDKLLIISKYLAAVILSLFLLNIGWNLVPNFAKSWLPGRSEYTQLKKEDDKKQKIINIKDIAIDSLSREVGIRDDKLKNLVIKEAALNSRMKKNSKLFKEATVEKVDSIIDGCNCL